jgi:hypothetical protein
MVGEEDLPRALRPPQKIVCHLVPVVASPAIDFKESLSKPVREAGVTAERRNVATRRLDG